MLLLPIIPFLSAVGMVTSTCAMAWYHGLKKDQKEQADRTATELAKGLYDKCVGGPPPGLNGETDERRLME